MNPDHVLRIILGRELFRETQLLAGDRESVADVVRAAVRQYGAASGHAPADQEPPAGILLSPHSREGPEAHQDHEPDRGASPASSPRPKPSPIPFERSHREPLVFSFQGCSFLLGDASLQILDDRGAEVTLSVGTAVAYLVHLQRAFGVALLERFLSPEDFRDPLRPR